MGGAVPIATSYSISGRIWRSVLPSSGSFIACAFAAAATVLVGLLQVSQKQGMTILGIRPSTAYMDPVPRTIDQLLSSASLYDVGIIVLWALVLLLIFGISEFLFGSYAQLHDATKEVQYKRLRSDSSERRWLLGRAMWRIAISVAAIVGGILLVRPLHWVSSAERTTASGLPLGQAIWDMTLSVIVWTVVYHVLVILIRLYTFRTRIFQR